MILHKIELHFLSWWKRHLRGVQIFVLWAGVGARDIKSLANIRSKFARVGLYIILMSC